VNYDLVGLGHLPRVAVFCVVALLVVNALARLTVGKRLFSSPQLLFVYVAILVIAGFPGQRLVTYLYFGMVGPQYHALGQGNEFATEVLPYIKPWMVPAKEGDDPVIAHAFHGLPDGEPVPWRAWVMPLIAWTPFFAALLALQLCVSMLLRRRWDEERLTYPLARVPVELTRYDSPTDLVPAMFRSRLFWAAFLIPVALHTKNALSFYYPEIRRINLTPNLGVLFGTRPWTNFDFFPVQMYFAPMGATYLVPTATACSLWFVWILRRFLFVARDQMGLMNQEQYVMRMGGGAYLLLAALYLWGARRTIARAFRASATEDDEPGAEPAAPRWALVGAAVSTAVLGGWGMKAGATPQAVLALVALWMAALIVLARLVAESGMFCVWAPMSPFEGEVVRSWPGRLTPQCTTALCYMGFNMSDTASASLANFLQALKVGDLGKLRAPSALWLMVGAMVVAYFASHPPSLYAIYSHGIYDLGWWCKGAPLGLPNNVHSLTTGLTRYDWRDGFSPMVWGALCAGALHAGRILWHRWPLQALAYAATLGPNWMMDRYGFSIFLGWAVKALLLRFGSVSLYNRMRPFPMGLIVGNACVLLFWTIYHYFRPIDGVLVTE